MLRSLAHAERELDRHLGELQALELVREKSQVPELEYIFKHALVQEASYESILLQQRRELHRRVGECKGVPDHQGTLMYRGQKSVDSSVPQQVHATES